MKVEKFLLRGLTEPQLYLRINVVYYNISLFYVKIPKVIGHCQKPKELILFSGARMSLKIYRFAPLST